MSHPSPAAPLNSVTRYVVTYVNADGMRTLIGASQGCNTYATHGDAAAYLAAMLANNHADTLRQVYGAAPAFEVRPVPCYPGHFDPMRAYFD